MVVEINNKHVEKNSNEPSLRFINTHNIIQIWQDGADIIIELSDYEKLKVQNENIHTFMDRFI